MLIVWKCLLCGDWRDNGLIYHKPHIAWYTVHSFSDSWQSQINCCKFWLVVYSFLWFVFLFGFCVFWLFFGFDFVFCLFGFFGDFFGIKCYNSLYLLFLFISFQPSISFVSLTNILLNFTNEFFFSGNSWYWNFKW